MKQTITNSDIREIRKTMATGSKIMFGDEIKEKDEDITWKETCLVHGKGELLPTYRAVLICKTKNIDETGIGHKPVCIFTSLSDEELHYHMVRL